MREYAAPPVPQASPWSRLTDPVVAHADQHPDAAQFALRVPGAVGPRLGGRHRLGLPHPRRRGRPGLLAAGVEVGDRVALLSRTRLEWTVLDYAIWWVGAVSVPVYATSSDAQIEWILRDSGCRFAFVETASYAERVAAHALHHTGARADVAHRRGGCGEPGHAARPRRRR